MLMYILAILWAALFILYMLSLSLKFLGEYHLLFPCVLSDCYSCPVSSDVDCSLVSATNYRKRGE